MKFVKFIYNPASGDGRFGHALDQIVSIYQKRGYTLIPYRLTFDKNEPEELVDGIENFCHHLLIAGGDGTINYVVNILQTKSIKTPIAVLPAGTANDFASLLGVPLSIPAACRAILSGELREIDLARANDLYFVNVFSCGLFTDVSQKTPTRLKHTFGKFAYYFSGMQEFPNFKKLQITVTSKGKEIYSGSSLLFFVFNGQTAGNLKIARLADIEDGLLDLLVMRDDNIVENIRTVTHFLRLSAPKAYPKGVFHFQGDEMVISSRGNESTDIDGQPGPSFPIRITCLPGALKVLCPKAKKKTSRTTANDETIVPPVTLL